MMNHSLFAIIALGLALGGVLGFLACAWRVSRTTGTPMRQVVLRGGGSGEER